MANMSNRPVARSTDLIVEEIGEEVLVYDTVANRGHSLTREAAKVWRSCDGATSVEELSAKLSLDDETVGRALNELSSCELLEEPTLFPVAEGSTRRDATKKMAKIGAAAFAAPLIISVTAPVAAHALTNCGTKHTGDCKTLNCVADPSCICCTGCDLTHLCRNNTELATCCAHNCHVYKDTLTRCDNVVGAGDCCP